MNYCRYFSSTTVLVTKLSKFQLSARIIDSQADLDFKTMGTSGAAVSPFSPQRIYAVDGFQERKNDVVYGPPLAGSDVESVVVFFPGDVQDYTENMEAHRDNKYHKQWNVESTAEKLQRKFQDCHILVIKPSRMGFKTFSCYENFVQSNQLGVPEHSPNHNALRHLDSLVNNILERLKLNRPEKEQNDVNSKDVTACKDPNLKDVKLKLIGFSKGCVVLNQFLHEFHSNTLEKNPEVTSIISKIKDMYWLDGGHSGGENTWVTDKHILGSLCSLEMNIHVHVTPYQIQDDRRPWIKKEEKAFSDYLTKHGCTIDRTVHFEAVPSSIITHFDVINAFRK